MRVEDGLVMQDIQRIRREMLSMNIDASMEE